MEDQAIVVRPEALDHGGYGRCRYPEHGKPESRFRCRHLSGPAGHGRDRLGRIVQDDPAQPVQTRHVGDRGHHHDVGNIDIGRDIAGRERRDHDLWQAEPQLAHACGDDRGAPASTDTDDAGNVLALGEEAREGNAHRLDRPAAVVAGKDGSDALRMAGRNRPGIYIDGGRRLARADIDAHDTAARRLDASRQIGKLLALRIGCADHVDPLHFSSATA